ncbi:peroxidase 31-like [Cannabis sativa]|uniref:peroxidase 31-like n=1 Tax=Cannabis sativa TaxID=3483 RepID=UPI0029CA5087|nr:peroxidase 31-like [Cannabis sativa]
MASSYFIPLLLSLSLPILTFFPSTTLSKLTPNYYQKSCPKFPDIVRQIVQEKQSVVPTTAAATLRLLFHDCLVEGCDASILIASNAFNKAERDAENNLSLSGDGFDVVTRIKTALELQCPGIVSCSDILATAARDLITIEGGPYYPVRLGRKDGLVSKAELVEGKLPRPKMPLTQLIALFASKKFTVQEMVALVGAHTIGFAHCSEFSNRIYNFSKKTKVDPAYNPKYAEGLRKLCSNYTKDPSMSAFNDVMTPNKFDNMYYKNLQRGLALLASDQALAVDKRTRPHVDLYATNQTKFFQDFAHAMEKLSVYKIKTGRKGEVRRRCDAFNNLKTA